VAAAPLNREPPSGGLATLFAQLVAVGCMLVVGAGMHVRVTVRDASPASAAIYYVLPLVVMAALLAVAALVWLGIGHRRVGAACMAAAVAFAGLWLVRNTYANPCVQHDGDVRVMLLNTARGHAGWDEIARELPPFDVDIIGLVEAGGKGPARQQWWEENFPEHHVYLPGGGLAILTRGDLRKVSVHRLDGISRYADAEIDLEGRLVHLILADFDASPRFDRKRLIGTVFRAAQSEPDVPTIVMGDFNTPIDSVWFERVRAKFHHVFEEAGSGMLVTWPTSMPLLAIDHVWVSDGITATCAAIESHPMSDHRLVTARLTLPSEDDDQPPVADSGG
jgi:endonuclease/exonuclease/phosphatase family metal-dependent hydrolase